MRRRRLGGVIGVTAMAMSMGLSPTIRPAAAATPVHRILNCTGGNPLCAEVYDSERVFGEGNYVGHDEPAALFYSDQAGSGNRMQYHLTLPSDPPARPLGPGKAFNFQLRVAFWFGLAMCDTQSFPEQLSTCTPDTDQNAVDPAVSPKHPGTAFTELQFYPPGWVPWPDGASCDATRWCAALNIDSLSFDPVTGRANNDSCLSAAGMEPVNFAFVTKDGAPHAPPSPLRSTLDTFTPNRAADLFMGSGDDLVVTMGDTVHGLEVDIRDTTTGQHGSMKASAANGFGQVRFDPRGSNCNPATHDMPYDFHPMYSTSSEKTRVPWAAHSYNVAFSDEIGHFDYCRDDSINPGATCRSAEGIGYDIEPTDHDDGFCFDRSASTLVQVSGCLASNTGFDGTSYQSLWPDGDTAHHPSPLRFTSPATGTGYGSTYGRMAFETDLPRVEPGCVRQTGSGCRRIPQTDDGQPAVFYPFFSDTGEPGHCYFQIGNHIPGSGDDFGQGAQYGPLLNLTFTGLGGRPTTLYEDFRGVLSTNPCPR